jgi:hypothetical protein
MNNKAQGTIGALFAGAKSPRGKNSIAHGAIGALFVGAKSPRGNNSIAQGTIEYLVVIAVVVVLSLVVVALVINVSSSPSQQVLDSSDKLDNVAVGGISIVEAVSDLDGDTLISLMNNSSEGITLKKITVGENDNNYDDYISGVDSVPISLTGLASSCPCESGQKSVKCEFVFEYLTKSGLTKIERRTINVQCTNSNEDPTPSNPNRVIEPIVPVLELGTLENPWIINDCLELQDMNQHLDGNYILGEDIDCSTDTSEGGTLYNGGLGFSPIGAYLNPFKGTLDGNKFTISGLNINRPLQDYVGLFGVMRNGNIYFINLENQNIIGKDYVGVIVGGMWDGILNSISVSSGHINGRDYVGSLVGGAFMDSYNGYISNCYNFGTISANNYVGGLVGVNFTSITNVYNAGEVNGVSYVGGLIGEENNGIYKSFNVGLVNGSLSYIKGLIGAVSGNCPNTCYWDINLSNNSSCYYASSCSPDQCISTNGNGSDYFGAVGIPFTNLEFDGNWVAQEKGYPILSWQ